MGRDSAEEPESAKPPSWLEGEAAEVGEPFLPPPDDDEIRRAMERFADVPITLSVQLDRKWMSVRKITGLKAGSVVKLDRSAGDNVELLMDGVPVANGEIVVIEEMMGLRVTDLILPKRHTTEK